MLVSYTVDRISEREKINNRDVFSMEQIKINPQHKDRLFRLIFGNEKYKENTLALYNALNNTTYENVEDLELTTIEDVIYIGMKNDLSFLIGDYMNLYEQQSTYNPNMPLRGFLYFSKLYDKYLSINQCNIYGRKLVKIPTPNMSFFIMEVR